MVDLRLGTLRRYGFQNLPNLFENNMSHRANSKLNSKETKKFNMQNASEMFKDLK